jgi:hypothetical protein
MVISPPDILFSYRWAATSMQHLVSDVADEQFAAQPVAAINHPAWLFGHVSIYNEVIVKLLRGESFNNPWDQPCGKNSQPTADRSAYASKDEIVARFASGVEEACRSMESATADAWSAPLEHPTWGKQFKIVATAITFLATTHLAMHLGQLSGWRRAMNLPRI